MPPYRKGTPEHEAWKQTSEGQAWMERITVNNRKMAQDPEWRRKVHEAAIRRSRDPRWKDSKVRGYFGDSYEQKMRLAFAEKLRRLNRDYRERQGK